MGAIDLDIGYAGVAVGTAISHVDADVAGLSGLYGGVCHGREVVGNRGCRGPGLAVEARRDGEVAAVQIGV